MSQEQAILVATGYDRPGVMDEIATQIMDLGGTIADSRSINLCGQFALLVLVKAPADAMVKIRAGADQMAEQIGIHLRLENPSSAVSSDTFPYRFTAAGRNHPKVIHAISHLMRVLGINIESLQTQETGHNGPEQRGFKMELGLSVPREVPIVKVREYLDHLCGEMKVQYELSAV